MTMTATLTPSRQDYENAFAIEALRHYRSISEFEARYGSERAIPTEQLLSAAAILACPVKRNVPNWQHGRILYTLARSLQPRPGLYLVDIGTAKGFSALCMLWGLMDAGLAGRIASVDVIDPKARVRRNTIAELDGFKTLAELLAPWPEAERIEFRQCSGVEWLRIHTPIALAFVDGKHEYKTVLEEGRLLAARQAPGDLVLFDDLQIVKVRQAVEQLRDRYEIEIIEAKPADRAYALAVRR